MSFVRLRVCYGGGGRSVGRRRVSAADTHHAHTPFVRPFLCVLLPPSRREGSPVWPLFCPRARPWHVPPHPYHHTTTKRNAVNPRRRLPFGIQGSTRRHVRARTGIESSFDRGNGWSHHMPSQSAGVSVCWTNLYDAHTAAATQHAKRLRDEGKPSWNPPLSKRKFNTSRLVRVRINWSTFVGRNAMKW